MSNLLDRRTDDSRLHRFERVAGLRLSPRRNRWRELAELDAKVGQLEARAGQLMLELAATRERLPSAEAEYQAALAVWHTSGQRGARPQSPVPALEAKLQALEEDTVALDEMVERALQEKADFVQRHRRRLVREADQATQDAVDHYLRLLEELERARDDLYEARASAVWAAMFPSELLNTLPPAAIAGGLRKPVEETLGITTQLAPGSIWKLLRLDAAALAEGATHEQRAALEGRDPRRDADAAVWSQTPEGQEAERRERRLARERYTRQWGHPPPEFG